MTAWKRIIPVVIFHCACVSAQADAPRVPAPDEADPIPAADSSLQSARIPAPQRFASGTPLKLRPSTDSRRMRADAVALGVVNIDPFLLTRPVDVQIAPGKPLIVFGVPADMARLDLDLDGKRFQLYYSQEANDGALGYRHVTMRVLNDEASYARFSIENSSGDMYGTLHTPDATYVFEQGGVRGEAVVYRYEVRRRSAVLDNQQDAIVGKSALARRHHQLEALEAIQPQHAWSNSRGTYLLGGDLGTISDISVASFVQATRRLSSLTQVTGRESFALIDVRRHLDGSRLATFRQLKDGVAIDAASEMVVDSSGKILRLSTSIVPADTRATKALISPSDARHKVRAEWEARHGRKLSGLKPTSAVELRLQWNSAMDALVPIYALTFESAGEAETFFARVDAISGQVELVDLIFNVNYVACKDATPATQTPPWSLDCASLARSLPGYANPPKSLYCTNPSTPNQSANCYVTDTKNPYEVLSEVQTIVPGAIATNAPGTPACCSEMDVTIVQNSKLPNLSTSRTSGMTIMMPPSDSSSAEILAHEMGHVYVNVYNDYLEVETNVFAASVREGTAYVFAELLGAISGRSDRYGAQWVYGDGQYYAGGQKSASSPQYQHWQDITTQAGGHDGGQVIFRFFRRLQEVAGINNQRLLGVLIGTMAAIRDAEGNGIDAGDFRRAVLSTIKSDESALRNAVATVYAELYRADASSPYGPPLPPGDPGPIGAPPITPSVLGSFSHCGTQNGIGVSVYATSWTATPNTDRYLGWVKANSEPAFRFSIEVPSGVTQAWLLTNVPAEGRISSCNSFGCSGLSLSRVAVTHVCGS